MEELLSLKWNNHKNTFLGVIKVLRNKASYSDVTLACEGKFYQAHKLVLSVCSDYFAAIFENIPSGNPVIVLKDISHMSLEVLLDYMYLGEVNVKQCDLSVLLKAAECLQIKGLAAPDDEFPMSKETKRTLLNDVDDPPAKRRKKRRLTENSESLTHTEASQPNSPIYIRDNLDADIKSEPLDKNVEENFISIEKEEIDDNNATQYEPSSSGVLNETSESWLDYNFDDDPDSTPCPIPSRESLLLHQFPNAEQFSETESKKPPQKVVTRSRCRKNVAHPFCCHICDYKTGLSCNLKRHIRVHTGEKPYKCDMCRYRTSDQSDMTRHKKNIHLHQFPNAEQFSETESKKLPQRVITRSRYRKSVDHPFCCHICDYKTDQACNLKRHIRIHTGEKPFKCDMCPLRTSDQSCLIRHKKMHLIKTDDDDDVE